MICATCFESDGLTTTGPAFAEVHYLPLTYVCTNCGSHWYQNELEREIDYLDITYESEETHEQIKTP